MIVRYEVKNFYSIGPEGAVVNFTVDGNAPKTNLYMDTDISAKRISLVETVIGPNASGKTKLLQGMAFLKYFLVASYGSDVNKPIPFGRHSLHREEPTYLNVEFIVKNRMFEYQLALDNEKVIEESLYEYSKTNERTTRKTVATRIWQEDKKEYLFSAKQLGLTEKADIRRNASMLSAAILKDNQPELVSIISDYWINSVVADGLWMRGNREDTASEMMLIDSLEFFHDKKNKTLLRRAKDILANYDLGFHDLESKLIKLLNGEEMQHYFVHHDFDSGDFYTEIHDESSGTQKVLKVLRLVLKALSSEHGGIAVVDEIDAFLHPDIVENIVDLFLNKTTNPYNAQILFTTHNHRLLSSFDKYQIILTEKNKDGSTESWRLDEMSGVKTDDNYYTKYISGAYGARPKIGEFCSE